MSPVVVLLHQLWPAVFGAAVALAAAYLSLKGITGRPERKPQVLIEVRRDGRTRNFTS